MKPLALLGIAILAGSACAGGEASYPYGSPTFARFVADSYAVQRGDPSGFTRWFENAYRTSKVKRPEKPTLRGQLAWDRARLARIRDPKQRAKAETNLGAWMHRMVKTIIPRFSLDRGFEFTNAQKLGERQCFLQSVLIVGLLQAAGVDSGVAMVWINDAGHESNNGHAVAVARLADGTDLVVDASFPDPFADQAGLFVADASGGYCFVRPVYSGHRLYVYGRRRYAGSRFIRSYRSSKGTGEIRVRMLDIPFLRSQFDYYRGERAPGGFTAKEKTPAGLAASARFLERAVRICPQNPLPVYVLGRVYARQGKLSLAKAQIVRGHALYERFGFVPRGPREAYAEVTGTGAVERKR